MKIQSEYQWQVITPEDGNFLFGYYDRNPFSIDNQKHLVLKIPQQERLPDIGEMADVGYVDIKSEKFISLQQTSAWCHQQGAMLEWLEPENNLCIYNDYIVGDCGKAKAVSRVCSAVSGEIERTYDFPVYVLSKNKRYAASLNFSRIPRRGYSYAQADITIEPPVPEDLNSDGLFLADMRTGKRELIVSYRQFIEKHPLPFSLDGCRIWLNHAIFNSDDSRLMVLLRQNSVDNPAKMWATYMYTMNLDGSELRCVLPEVYWKNSGISHQIWGRTPGEVLIDGNWHGNGNEYIIFDESAPQKRFERISEGMGPMGHLIFSPDGRWLAADTYSVDGYQRLAIVEVASGRTIELGRFAHPEVPIVDVRCDLHPRWSGDGRYMSVDTINFGQRKICLLDLSLIVG